MPHRTISVLVKEKPHGEKPNQTEQRSDVPDACMPLSRAGLRVTIFLFFLSLNIFQLFRNAGTLLPESNTMPQRGRAVLCCLVLPACLNPEHTLFYGLPKCSQGQSFQGQRGALAAQDLPKDTLTSWSEQGGAGSLAPTAKC